MPINQSGCWSPICEPCLTAFDQFYKQQTDEQRLMGKFWDFLYRSQIELIASQDRSAQMRWVRRFIAVGRHTPSEFNTLCERYGNICLRCGKKLPLVADHVIPFAKGGSDDISNIQPLCARCNAIKCDKTTDYRKRRRQRLPPC